MYHFTIASGTEQKYIRQISKASWALSRVAQVRKKNPQSIVFNGGRKLSLSTLLAPLRIDFDFSATMSARTTGCDTLYRSPLQRRKKVRK